jgi:hypothetical protein
MHRCCLFKDLKNTGSAAGNLAQFFPLVCCLMDDAMKFLAAIGLVL